MESVLLFGAGQLGKRALRILREVETVHIKGFVDNNKNLHKVEGVSVFSPDEAITKSDCDIIVTVSDCDPIINQLKDMGYERFHIGYVSFLKKNGLLPNALENTEKFEISGQWWYYHVELLPGLITKGVHLYDSPMLPRLNLRNIELKNMDCLDLGTMEGLIPTLMSRAEAKVLAIDAIGHCIDKLEMVKHYYNVDFEYRSVGLMYDLDKKIEGSFDLINCSGLLYHTISPLTVLAGMRSLVKKNGLVIVSTNAINEDEYRMEFNNGGRLQEENNTFWYISIPLLDYMLRFLGLAPIDCLWQPYTKELDAKYIARGSSRGFCVEGMSLGYISVVCRAVDESIPTEDDKWMTDTSRLSWESQGLIDWKRAVENPVSNIEFFGNKDRNYIRSNGISIDLLQAVRNKPPVTTAEHSADAHILRLEDKS